MSNPDTTQRPDEPPPGWIVSGAALCGPDGRWRIAETREHALDIAWAMEKCRRPATDGCCHRTRIKDAACPLGLVCPFDRKEVNDAKP